MKNRDKWQPSKFVQRNGKLIASRNVKEVGVSSRLVADRVARWYDMTLRQHAKGKLLDLGCGKVPFFGAYRDYVTDNVCVDWYNSPHKGEYVDYEVDLTKPLPFGDGEFDTIILSDVLEHIPNPEQLWQEMARILASSGKIILNVPFFYCLHEPPYDYYRYTEFALRRFVEISGLSLVDLTRSSGAPEIVTDIFAKNIIRMPIIGRPLAQLAQWLTSYFVKGGVGKRASEATSRCFPGGYFLIAEKKGSVQMDSCIEAGCARVDFSRSVQP